MPPEIPDEKLLARKTGGEVVQVTPADAVMGFYDVSGMECAIQASEFDSREEMETIIRHIRDGDARVSLQALRHFRTVLKDVLVTSGRIGLARQEVVEEQEGRKMRRSVATQTLLTRMEANSEHAGSGHRYEHLPPQQPLDRPGLAEAGTDGNPGPGEGGVGEPPGAGDREPD